MGLERCRGGEAAVMSFQWRHWSLITGVHAVHHNGGAGAAAVDVDGSVIGCEFGGSVARWGLLRRIQFGKQDSIGGRWKPMGQGRAARRKRLLSCTVDGIDGRMRGNTVVEVQCKMCPQAGSLCGAEKPTLTQPSLRWRKEVRFARRRRDGTKQKQCRRELDGQTPGVASRMVDGW